MKRKTDVWNLQQTMFLTWNQLRRYISEKLYVILGRGIHPMPNVDNGYWDIITDELSPQEEAKLCAVFAKTALDKRRFRMYYRWWQKDISAIFVEKLISQELPFTVKWSLPVENGVYFFGGSAPYLKNKSEGGLKNERFR